MSDFKEAVARFVQKCGQAHPYRFLDTLIHDGDTYSTCRVHSTEKVPHSYGEQVRVCPECFPDEVAVSQ